MGENNGGCSVIGLALVGLVVLGLAAYLVGNLAQWQDAQASRLYAEAALQDAWGRSQAQVIIAEGQARLDSAQAFAVTAGASLPWLVMGVVGMAGAALLVSVVAIFALSLAALRGQQAALPGPGRVVVLPQPARPALPQLNEPGEMLRCAYDPAAGRLNSCQEKELIR
jgi:hypothetical protein